MNGNNKRSSERSRWLNIGQVHFCVSVDRDQVSVNKNAVKNEDNIQPF